MERWVDSLGRHEERPDIDAFLTEIEQVCQKHGLSISHEDTHGSFIIEGFDADNIKWLNRAFDGR